MTKYNPSNYYKIMPPAIVLEKQQDLLDERLKRITEQNVQLIRQIFFPEETLESIGNKWHISRERVRQIINAHGLGDYKEIRKELGKNGIFRCAICGKPLNPRGNKNRKYCSTHCYKITTKFDVNNPQTCTYCKKKFFANRNWKYYQKRTKSISFGTFCCIGHYIAYQKKIGGISPANIEKLRGKIYGKQ